MAKRRIKTKLKGIRYEREVRKFLEENEWKVIRSAASLTPVDLVAIRNENIWFIQCKSKKPNRKEYEQFKNFAVPSYVEKYFVYPKGKEKFYFLPV